MTFQYDVVAGRTSGAFPGALTQPNQPKEIVSALPYASNPPVRYGDPVVLLSNGNIRPVGAGDTMAGVTLYGFLVLSYPTQQLVWPPIGFSNIVGGVPTGDTLSVLREGYIAVQVGSGTPAIGAPVYARTISHSGVNTVVGSLDAAADGANNFAITGVEWAKNGVDSNGFGEIRARIA